MSKLAELERLWRQRFPRRARGGANALAGFRYQFQITLLRMVRNWRSDEPGAFVAPELVSDILEASKDRTVISQVKLGSSSQALRAALGEIELIDCIAKEIDLHPDYRVVVGRQSRAGFDEVRSAWATHVDKNLADRLVISAELAPDDELVLLLSREPFRARNPVEWIEVELGKMLLRAGNDAVALGREIWSDLHFLSSDTGVNRLPNGMRVLSSTDVALESGQRREIRTGQQPTLQDFRRKCFMDRWWILDDLHKQFTRWVVSLQDDSDSEASDPRLPVFWIGGRSGSGKSVLLLQLVSSLVSDLDDPIVWLSGGVELLPSAFAWTRSLLLRGAKPIIALDDPYSPDVEGGAAGLWREALAEIADLLEENVCPLVLCAGPSEQSRYLSDELESKIAISRFVVDDTLDAVHIEELKDWFVRRTGTPPWEAANGGSDNMLIVQRMFQWRAGSDLSQFATRLRDRLRAMHEGRQIERVVSEILSLNRLYIGFPSAALAEVASGQLYDSLNNLLAENHLAVDGNKRGVWIAHAHLANEIWKGWFRFGTEGVQCERFVGAANACLKFELAPGRQMAPIWAVARSFRGGAVIIQERVQGLVLQRLLGQSWRATKDFFNGEIPTEHLAVWVHVGLVSGNDGKGVHEAFDVAQQHLRTGDFTDKGTRPLCHMMIALARGADMNVKLKVAASIRKLLERSMGWLEWPSVAADFVSLDPSPQDARLIARWTRNRTAEYRTGALLLATYGTHQDAIAPSVMAHLSQADGASVWCRLVVAILKVKRLATFEHSRTIEDWIERNRLSDHVALVLKLMVHQGADNAQAFAREWVLQHPLGRGAHYLMEVLLGEGPCDAKLRDAILLWSASDHPAAGAPLAGLVDALKDDHAVHRGTLDWLERNGTSIHFAYVQERLSRCQNLMSEDSLVRFHALINEGLFGVIRRGGAGALTLQQVQTLVRLIPVEPSVTAARADGLCSWLALNAFSEGASEVFVRYFESQQPPPPQRIGVLALHYSRKLFGRKPGLNSGRRNRILRFFFENAKHIPHSIRIQLASGILQILSVHSSEILAMGAMSLCSMGEYSTESNELMQRLRAKAYELGFVDLRSARTSPLTVE